MFFWNSLAYSMIQWMLTVRSLVPLPFLKPAWTSKFTVHVLLKPGLENFEHYFTSVWHECNCVVVWAFFGIALLWDWNENWPFTEELYKKYLHNQYNHNGVITHLEPDILECEVKWALESITTNRASGGDGIPVELFQILEVDPVKVLHSICQQIWKTQQWPQD